MKIKRQGIANQTGMKLQRWGEEDENHGKFEAKSGGEANAGKQGGVSRHQPRRGGDRSGKLKEKSHG